jgi:hypothetical protein
VAEWQMEKFATLVWRNLRRSPRRTILTILAIALAAFTYSSLSSLPNVAPPIDQGALQSGRKPKPPPRNHSNSRLRTELHSLGRIAVFQK